MFNNIYLIMKDLDMMASKRKQKESFNLYNCYLNKKNYPKI